MAESKGDSGWLGATNRAMQWLIATLLVFGMGWAASDRADIIEALSTHSNRLTVIESTYVSAEELRLREHQTELFVQQEVDRIIRCLNKIQRGQTCDL